MSDSDAQNQSAEQEPQTTEAQDAPVENAPNEQDPQGNEEQNTEESDIPEWAQKKLRETRGEAAEWRKKFRTLQDEMKELKTPEQVQEAVQRYEAQIAELEVNLLRQQVAGKHGLPEALAARLVGTTAEELEADAEALAGLVSKPTARPKGEPRGGLDPSEDDSPLAGKSPAELAAMARQRRH